MKMKPIGDQLLLKPIKEESKSEHGLILSSDSSAYGKAEVIASGIGVRTMTGDLIEMVCKTGDTVLLPTRFLSGKNGNEVKLDGETYVLVRESEIALVSV